MEKRKIRKIIICGIAAILFITPIIVLAVVYNSSSRVNSFKPGEVDIQVRENATLGDQLKNTLTLDVTDKSTDKAVNIYDTRTNDDEEIRVCFVPMWYSKDAEGDPAEICNVFDFSETTQSGNTLVYQDGAKTITLNLNENWHTNGWEYKDDGCFYYSGALDSNDFTPQLLDSVVLNNGAYALTETYLLRIDVLSDAIQTSGNANGVRGWADAT